MIFFNFTGTYLRNCAMRVSRMKADEFKMLRYICSPDYC